MAAVLVSPMGITTDSYKLYLIKNMVSEYLHQQYDVANIYCKDQWMLSNSHIPSILEILFIIAMGMNFLL